MIRPTGDALALGFDIQRRPINKDLNIFFSEMVLKRFVNANVEHMKFRGVPSHDDLSPHHDDQKFFDFGVDSARQTSVLLSASFCKLMLQGDQKESP